MKFIKRFRLDSLLVPSIFLIYLSCQLGLRYRNITFEGIKSDLRGFPDDYAWILWIAPFLGVFIFSLSNQYKSLFGLFTTKNIYNFFLLFLIFIGNFSTYWKDIFISNSKFKSLDSTLFDYCFRNIFFQIYI